MLVDVEFFDVIVVFGFVDMYVYGGGGVLFVDGNVVDIVCVVEFYLWYGIIIMLVSLVIVGFVELFFVVGVLVEVIWDGVVVGIYLEGLWLSLVWCGVYDYIWMCVLDFVEIELVFVVVDGVVWMVMLVFELFGSDVVIWCFCDVEVVVVVGYMDVIYIQI